MEVQKFRCSKCGEKMLLKGVSSNRNLLEAFFECPCGTGFIMEKSNSDITETSQWFKEFQTEAVVT